jgi:uncharacterized protein
MSSRSATQFVVKISKYCNLRCSYCYEYAELSNKERMPLDRIARIFEHIASRYEACGFESINFVWHGGEPFLIPLDYYRQIGELQRDIFAEKLHVWNVVQTNLTVLTERHLEFLQSQEFISGLGVSFDVYGDQRVDQRGRLRTQIILENIQKLLDRGIEFGAIAVLARNTLAHVAHIYRFYNQLGVECRFLPFYMNAFDEQISAHALTADELVAAFIFLFDAWLGSEHPTSIEPIDEYLDFAIAYLGGRRDHRYEKDAHERVFVVNLDGGVWGAGDTYVKELKYGDLSCEDMHTILKSPGRSLAITQSQRRIAHYCEKCPYFGACPGFFVGDASLQQQRLLSEYGCPVRHVIDHIVDTLRRNCLDEVVVAQTTRQKSLNAALAVSL